MIGMMEDGEVVYGAGDTTVFGTDVYAVEEGGEGYVCVVAHDGGLVGFCDGCGGGGVGGGSRMICGVVVVGGCGGIGNVVEEATIVG